MRQNLRVLRDFARHHQVDLAPHGKSTMCPQLYQDQIEVGGAWGITAATVQQCAVVAASRRAEHHHRQRGRGASEPGAAGRAEARLPAHRDLQPRRLGGGRRAARPPWRPCARPGHPLPGAARAGLRGRADRRADHGAGAGGPRRRPGAPGRPGARRDRVLRGHHQPRGRRRDDPGGGPLPRLRAGGARSRPAARRLQGAGGDAAHGRRILLLRSRRRQVHAGPSWPGDPRRAARGLLPHVRPRLLPAEDGRAPASRRHRDRGRCARPDGGPPARARALGARPGAPRPEHGHHDDGHPRSAL